METGTWDGILIRSGKPSGVPADPAHLGITVVDKDTGDHWQFDADKADWVKSSPHSEGRQLYARPPKNPAHGMLMRDRATDCIREYDAGTKTWDPYVRKPLT